MSSKMYIIVRYVEKIYMDTQNLRFWSLCHGATEIFGLPAYDAVSLGQRAKDARRHRFHIRESSPGILVSHNSWIQRHQIRSKRRQPHF